MEMEMTDKNSIVVVYDAHTGAEEGVKELQRAGFDIKRLSIVGREFHTEENVGDDYNTSDHTKHRPEMSAFWGGLGAGLVGGAFFVIPRIGAVLVAGPLALTMVRARAGEDMADAMSALGAGLYSIGIPKDAIVRYESALRAGKLLLIACGTPQEVMKARDTLHGTHPDELNIHFVDKRALAPA
jgi:hypothetical protein